MPGNRKYSTHSYKRLDSSYKHPTGFGTRLDRLNKKGYNQCKYCGITIKSTNLGHEENCYYKTHKPDIYREIKQNG